MCYAHVFPCTKQLTSMMRSCCTSNQFVLLHTAHSCLLLSKFQQISCPYITAFAHVSLMLSCLGTATTLYIYPSWCMILKAVCTMRSVHPLNPPFLLPSYMYVHCTYYLLVASTSLPSKQTLVFQQVTVWGSESNRRCHQSGMIQHHTLHSCISPRCCVQLQTVQLGHHHQWKN